MEVGGDFFNFGECVGLNEDGAVGGNYCGY